MNPGSAPIELSVVIPALNEAAALPRLLDDLRAQQGISLEVIVADGGSADGTPALAAQAGACVVQAPRGRGAQMNAGAQAAGGTFLLFLHADTRLPLPTLLTDALAYLRAEIAQAGSPRLAGHFPLRFARSGPGHEMFYRYLEEKTALNRPYTINGDQGMLLTAAYFRELGGYDTRLPFLEDQRLAARVRQTGDWRTLPGFLVTSARRFETEGHRERYTLMAILMGLHAAGADELLAALPQAYATQDRAAKLDLAPFHKRIRTLLRQAGWRRSLGIVLRAGAFVRENAWQLFFYRDVRRGLAPAQHSALDFYDRRIERLIANRFCNALAALLMCGWFFLWLPLSIRGRRSPAAGIARPAG